MFHSSANKELELFTRWRSDFPGLEIKLVKGNHDILNKKWYAQSDIELFDSTLKISDFCFQHDPGECGKDDDGRHHYVFSGHVHPGITIHGSGKQTLKFPCFYFTDSYCILPAFSRFTGTVGIHLKEDDVVFAIVNNSLLRVN
jgi:metallophosphoesterase superfamily enzyme